MTGRRNLSIRKVLGRGEFGLRDIDRIAHLLKNEPVARVRRLRSRAVLCLEDVAAFSCLLRDEFPEAVYFFLNYKTGHPRPPKYSDDLPIVLFPSLREAVEAAIEAPRPRPDIVCRWPWPEELASGEPERLIGGRDFPDAVFDLAIQYRDLGRWFRLSYAADGYVDPRTHLGVDGKPFILSRGSLNPKAYPPFQLLLPSRDSVWKDSEFFTLYDMNDPETMAFSKRAHALWRRLSTSKVAVYDPSTGKVVVPEAKPGDAGSIGKQALAHALENPPRYPTWVSRPRQKGPALMIGPRPVLPKRRTKTTS